MKDTLGGEVPTPLPADPAATPAPTAMEEAWSRATQLLEPRFRKLAAETIALEGRYRPIAQACFASANRASSGAGSAAGHWLASLKRAPGVIGSGRSGIPLNDGEPPLDCQVELRHLVSRADERKAVFDETEDLARTRGVLPGHWRELLAAHRLDGWDEY